MGIIRVLFLHMPLGVPAMPNLAAETLRAVCNRSGFSADVLYGTLRMERTAELAAYLHHPLGQVIFNPAVAGSGGVEETAERVWQNPSCRSNLKDAHARMLQDAQGGAGTSLTEAALRGSLCRHLEMAERCLQRCLADIPAGRYQVYAFSLPFDSQKLASLALARRLKAREPEARVLFGGTACDGPMGKELLRAFPYVDAVAQGDADVTLEPILSALLGRRGWDGVGGVLRRERGEIRCGPPAAPLADLDWLPVPDYDQFLEQMAASDFADEEPFVLFETSRGCWWGEKHHCPFCGLRADGLAFRRKSPDRALSEIRQLSRRYPRHRRLYATDAILDHRYLRELFPRLGDLARTVHQVSPPRRTAHEWSGAEEPPPWRLFFELKSNLSKRDVALLAEAGVRSVQPGIESFGDRVLRLMDKGNRGLKHVQLIKWLDEYRLETIYNLIVGSPGETAEDYGEVIRLLPRLHHLTPPRQISLLNLDRFSPYHEQAARYGIDNVRPSEASRSVWAGLSVDLDQMLYQFDYDSAEQADPRLRQAWNGLEAALRRWRQEHDRRSLWLRRRPWGLELIEEENRSRSSHPLTGAQASLYGACDQARGFGEIRRLFPGIAESALRYSLECWVCNGWACRSDDDMYLALAVDVDPPGSRQLESRKGDSQGLREIPIAAGAFAG